MLKMADLNILESLCLHTSLSKGEIYGKEFVSVCSCRDGKSSRNLGNRRNVGKQAVSICVCNSQTMKFSLVNIEMMPDCVSGILYALAQLKQKKGFSRVLKDLILLNILSETRINIGSVDVSHCKVR